LNRAGLEGSSAGKGSGPVDCPSCSVVICTRDRPEHLDQSLNALSSLEYPRFEILVVDNAPSNGLTRDVANRWGVRYTLEPLPGLSRARNRGASECGGDIVAYLDDDAIAAPQWLCGLAAEFKDPRVMAVAGRVVPLEPTGEQGRKCATIAGVDRGERRRTFDLDTPSWFESANFGGIGIGANMALRKSAFNVWTGFNPRLGRGARVQACEENHAFFELIAAGYRVVYTPDAVVMHHAPQSLGELRAEHLRMLREAGAYLTFLLIERSDCRSATFRFIVEGLAGRRHSEAAQTAAAGARIAPRWREIYAAISGGLLYAATSLSARLAGEP
jgi:GT2 family glycosyltransferase